MRNITVASIQMQCVKDSKKNIETAKRLVLDAAKKGAQVILLPELFENLYFCQEKNYDSYQLATTVEENEAIKVFKEVAKENEVVLPISFYEKAGNTFYNSIAVIDADGRAQRKSFQPVHDKTECMVDREYAEQYGSGVSREVDRLYIGGQIVLGQHNPFTFSGCTGGIYNGGNIIR